DRPGGARRSPVARPAGRHVLSTHLARGTMTDMSADSGTTRELTVGTGTGLETADMVLNIGPQHPSTHGVLRLRLVLDGERVVSREPIVGYMHRGAEKLFE